MTRRPLCLVCLLLMLGMCLADLLGFPLIRGNPLPQEVQSWVEKHPEATVCGEVEKCTAGEFSVSVWLKESYLIYNSEKVSIENVKVFLKENELVPAGTIVLLSGKLERVPGPRNPGEFDSRQYYACEHIYYFLKDAQIEKKSESYSAYRQFLLNIRESFSKVFTETAGEAAAMFQAIVLGDKSSLEDETKLRYQMGGIVHIMAISGLHISVLGVGLYQLLMQTGMGIWPSGLIALIVMLQFGMMTGGTVSAMRAVCMFLISVGAKMSGRIYDMMTALAAAAILILMESPAYLYSSGFLLSFGAVLGIGVVSPAVMRLAGARTKIGKSLLASLSVQLTTLPVMLYFYGEVSLAGIFLNLVVLPTVSVVLGSGVAAALLGQIFLQAGAVAAVPGRILLWGYEKLCVLTGKIPFLTWTGGQPKIWQIALYYGFLGIVLWMDYRNYEGKRMTGSSEIRMPQIMRRWNRTASEKILQRMLCTLCIAAGIALLGYHPCPELKITCLDVGQGDGIVVETPEKYRFLIDGGSSSKSKVGQYQILPFLKSQGISRLDGILVSHTDGDHISGVQELLDFMGKGLISLRVDCLYLPRLSCPSEEWKELVKAAEKADVQVHMVSRGDTVKAGELKLAVLSPKQGASGENVNEDAMVFRLEYKDFSGLFTGDIGAETEEKLMEENMLADVDFLKVGHHGSRHSTCQPFLDTIRPQSAVISCSETNTYGHPSPETIERLESSGCQVEYTMKNGAITLETDGEEMQIRRFLSVSGRGSSLRLS